MSRAPLGRLVAPPLLALAVACACRASATAAEVDLFGGVTAAGGRVENPGFLDTGTILSPSGSLTGGLQLRGGLAATWRSSRFDVLYSPSADFYEQEDLDRVSHSLSSSWRHDYSPRGAILVTEDATYTPEQNLDPNRLDDGGVLVRRTRAASSRFTGEFAFQRTPRTRLLWRYRHSLRAYDAGELIDSSRHDAGFGLQRGFARHGFLRAGYEYALYRFSGGEPAETADAADRGAAQHLGYAGLGVDLPGGLRASLDGGYERLAPDDRARDVEGDVFVRSELGYGGRRAQAAAGWSRGFSDGGGALENAQTQQAHASVRLEMGRWLAAEIAATGAAHERVRAEDDPPGGAGTVRTFIGTAGLTWRIAGAWTAFARWSYYRQTSDLAAPAAPEIRNRRYTVGVSWSFT